MASDGRGKQIGLPSITFSHFTLRSLARTQTFLSFVVSCLFAVHPRTRGWRVFQTLYRSTARSWKSSIYLQISCVMPLEADDGPCDEAPSDYDGFSYSLDAWVAQVEHFLKTHAQGGPVFLAGNSLLGSGEG